MPPVRPGSATAAGVLAIIYGSIFTLCGLCGAIALIAQGAMGADFMGGGDPMQAEVQKKIQDAMERDVPAYHVMQIAGTVVGLLEALGLLVGGIGVLYLRPWARKLTLTMALVTVVSTILQLVYQLIYVIPAMQNAFQVVLPAALPQAPGPQAEQVMVLIKTMMTVSAVGIVIVYIIFTIYLLIIAYLLGRGHVRAAFAGQGVAEVEHEGRTGEPSPRNGDDEDTEWQRPRRPQEPEDDWRIRG